MVDTGHVPPISHTVSPPRAMMSDHEIWERGSLSASLTFLEHFIATAELMFEENLTVANEACKPDRRNMQGIFLNPYHLGVLGHGVLFLPQYNIAQLSQLVSLLKLVIQNYDFGRT